MFFSICVRFFWTNSYSTKFTLHITQQLNVWVGMYDDCILGTFFLPGNLTREMYFQFLQNPIYSLLLHIFDHSDHDNENNSAIRYCVDLLYWSLYLSPLHFLRNRLKTTICKTNPASVDDLSSVTPQNIENCFENNFYTCMEAGDQYFELLLTLQRCKWKSRQLLSIIFFIIPFCTVKQLKLYSKRITIFPNK